VNLLHASLTGVIACAAVAALAQSPTFSTRVELVRLDVLVTEGGKPVRGLSAADFEVRDNGMLQTLEHVSFEQVPLHVVLTLDTSASVTGARLDHLREAGDAVLAALKPGDEAALMTFTHALAQNAALTSRIDVVRAALREIDAKGDTALIDGVYAALNVAHTSSGRGLVIVFSDGRDTASFLTEAAGIDAARQSEAVVYAVAVGGRRRSFLPDLVEISGGRLFEVESTGNLRGIFLSVLEEFRQRYLLSYTPRGVQKPGWHALDIKVKGRRANVKARGGYMAASAR
jgi:Ca-activated chloride channel family protein